LLLFRLFRIKDNNRCKGWVWRPQVLTRLRDRRWTFKMNDVENLDERSNIGYDRVSFQNVNLIFSILSTVKCRKKKPNEVR